MEGVTCAIRAMAGGMMARRDTGAALRQFTLDRGSALPLHRQLSGSIRDAILAGELPAGARLPSILGLASKLGVARNTVAEAYAQLQEEGYLRSTIGAGTVVAPTISAPSLPPSGTDHAAATWQPDLPTWQGLPVGGAPPPLWPGVPALDAFPYATWARLVAQHARRSLPALSSYQEPAGYAPLRATIAGHLVLVRGMRCTPEQIIVTSGSQGALDLVARVLCRQGDQLWMEDPGNTKARVAFSRAGVGVIPRPVDAEGLVMPAADTDARRATLAYVTPAQQFPLGMAMSLPRRLALLEWARRSGARIVEEDFDSDLRFRGRSLTALQGLDPARVVHVGTFSRLLFPALRLGYLVSPPELVAAFVAARRFIDRHPPILEQLALADFLAEGHLARHVRRMRTLYAGRATALVAALREACGGLLDVEMPSGGLHLVGRLPPGLDDRAVARRAQSIGIGAIPVAAFAMEPQRHGGLMLGYGAVFESDIPDLARRLATAIRAAHAEGAE
jgi:GntR family transcriptional regulator/MocR family aminotransferase